jgi:hypothetical protein
MVNERLENEKYYESLREELVRLREREFKIREELKEAGFVDADYL